MRRRALRCVALCSLMLLAPEFALARQHRATFLFTDENGEIRQETLTDVRYVYVERRLLNTRGPDSSRTGSPLPYRDRPIRRRALLLQGDRISFNLIRSLEFSYRETGISEGEELIVRATMNDGIERDIPASNLRGFEGVRPPYLEGETQDGEKPMRFELPPFRRQDSGSELSLTRVVFHHGARR